MKQLKSLITVAVLAGGLAGCASTGTHDQHGTGAPGGAKVFATHGAGYSTWADMRRDARPPQETTVPDTSDSSLVPDPAKGPL